MKNLNIGITPATAASRAKLLAKGIQDDTLIQLGRIIAEGDTNARDLIDALEDLGTVANGTARDGELDKALDDVRHHGHLDDPVMDLSPGDVQQLADQATAALPTAATVVHLPAQCDRRWTA